MTAKNIHGLAAAVASVASVAMLGALCVAPATALSDVDLDGASVAAASGATTGVANAAASGSQLSQLKAQTVADASSDSAAMPDNPDAALPSQVAADIPDDATVVSEDHAVTDEGELKDIETGETVTDEKLVGTKDSQPDPLAKTDGESFIPVSADEVKQKVAGNGGDVNATVEGGAADRSGDAANGDADANAGTDGSADDSANGGQGTANSDQNAADGSAKTSASKSKKADSKDTAATKSTVKLAALQNGEYGAHWGSYNGTAAFFDANNNLFAQQAKGVIDVSAWQGDIDWQAAKNAGVEGAIIRISYGWGNGFDTKALRNISECKRLGIPFGVYSYSYSYDAGTATEEGKDIVSLLRQAGVNPGDLSYPVFYDLEKWSWTGHTPPTSPSVYDGIVNAWYGQLQAAGYNNLSVYSYTSYLNGPLNSGNIHGKTRWVAQYGATMQYTAFPANDRGWQYTSSGKIAGITGNVDLNAFGNKSAASGGNGTAKNGWQTIDGKKYWFDNGVMARNKQVRDPATGKWYWFNADGTMARGVMNIPDGRGAKWVYYDINTGEMRYGEQYLSYDADHTGWYYFDVHTGAMAHGVRWMTSNGGKWVYY
ncbi:GH25 family lysozyme, partial [Bifidobacterium platyrrhinorum]